MTLRSVVKGTGSALPARRVDNAELADQVETSDEWIVERTGIRSRYVAADGETTATLAVDACRKALESAGIEPKDIGLIILATATPDQTFPSSATKVQALLGIDDCIAFDVHAVCTGFLYAVSVADSMIRAGTGRTALVIGAETFSRILDWEDRTTCVLFGDGAGALVVEAQEGGGSIADRGVLAASLRSDARGGSPSLRSRAIRPACSICIPSQIQAIFSSVVIADSGFSRCPSNRGSTSSRRGIGCAVSRAGRPRPTWFGPTAASPSR